LLTSSQCDEKRPLCGNCERRFGDIEKCEFEDVDVSGVKAKTTYASPPRPLSLTKIEAKPIGPQIDLSLVKASAADLQALREAFSPASPLMRSIRGDMLDPFATHPESKINDADLLMKHCRYLF
jgi:hypothetical protein